MGEGSLAFSAFFGLMVTLIVAGGVALAFGAVKFIEWSTDRWDGKGFWLSMAAFCLLSVFLTSTAVSYFN